jgi:hypothetical protein
MIKDVIMREMTPRASRHLAWRQPLMSQGLVFGRVAGIS